MENNVCKVCNLPALQSCSACNFVYYCSKEHQKIDWSSHKNKCAPYKIVTEDFKSHLIATRDIPQGQEIMIKNAVVTGPDNEDKPCCIGCYKEYKNYFNTCRSCEQKFCSDKCLIDENHLKICKYIPHNETKCLTKYILPLKLLLLKSKNNKHFQLVLNLSIDDHIKLLNKDPQLIENLTIISDKIGSGTTEQEIEKMILISKRYFWKVTNTETKNTKAFYLTTNLLKHDCVPNTRNIFYPNNQLHLIAKTPIKKGQILSTTFCEPLWGTLERRLYLKNTKLLDCYCKRCHDVTEFDTFLSSMYCRKCKDSLVVEDGPKIIATDPLSLEAPWKCEKCDNTIPAKQMQFGIKNLNKEIQQCEMDEPKNLEHFLFKYGEVLHSTNSFSLRVKLKLMEIYGNMRGFEMDKLPEELLDRKIELCHEILEIAEILDPGYSRLRGDVLYELQAALVAQTKLEFCKELSTKFEAEIKLRESLDFLQESVKILSLEPEIGRAHV